MKTELNAGSFLVAVLISIVLVAFYEYYWRFVEQYPLTYELQSHDIWADQRARVDALSDQDIIILGSSRGHFDINIELWNSITGQMPLMLAYPGSSPYHPFEDIVNKTDFAGLLIVSVAPDLFYVVEGSWAANQGKDFVDHYYKRTYAQQFNQAVYYNLESRFSYLNNDLSLQNLIASIELPNRDSIRNPVIWPPMVSMARNRNIRMAAVMETDTVIQRRQKDIWYEPDPSNRYKDSINTIMDYYAGLATKMKQRGGKVVFIRPPSDGWYIEIESKLFPDSVYWDRLLIESDCKGYHFKDYESTKYMSPPEWSHLNKKDSDIYTRALVELLHADKIL